MADRLVWNMWKTKAVRASEIKEVRWFKGEDRENNDKDVYIVYGAYGNDNVDGGFTFGKFNDEDEAKEFVEALVELLTID